jgi:hypothetical protein
LFTLGLTSKNGIAAPAGVLFFETARAPFVFCLPLMGNPFFSLLASQKS